MPTPVYAYVRFSTKAQEMGTSIKRQREAIADHCADNGWVVDEEITDLGRSGFKGDHLRDAAGLGSFANRVRAGTVPTGSILVVENIDRLSRKEPIDVFNWMQEMCGLGLRIAFCDGDKLFDSETLRGEDAMMRVMEVWWTSSRAHGESKRKSRIMRKTWRGIQEEAARTLKPMSRQAPHWLVVLPDKSGFERIKDRVDLVNEIYQMSADGLGVAAIARKLNERGLRSWGPKSPKSTTKDGWHRTSLRRLLLAPQVEGDYVPQSVHPGAPERITGYYPRIVDADLVARARTGVIERKGTGGNNTLTFNNLFSGLFRCTGCSGKMEFRKPTKNTNYKPETRRGYVICGNALMKRGCERTEVFRYGAFEDACLDTLLSRAMDGNHFIKGAEARDKAIALAEAQKRLTQLGQHQSGALTLAIARPDSKALMERLDVIEAELAAAQDEVAQREAELNRAKGQVPPAEHAARIIEVRDAIDSDDPAERSIARVRVHTALRSIVDVVWCDIADGYGGEVRRTFTVICVGGAMNFKFENKGGLIAEADVMEMLRIDYAFRAGVGADDPRAGRRLDALQRRAKPIS